jgi:Glutathione S-transferase, N-terminal domain
MTDIILHHYDISPYSEKVRTGLGLKGLAWASVELPVIMPKPNLTALTGGYRKTPVLQIGADIYMRQPVDHARTRAPVPHSELLSRRTRRGRRACLVGREDNLQPGCQHRVREETRRVA